MSGNPDIIPRLDNGTPLAPKLTPWEQRRRLAAMTPAQRDEFLALKREKHRMRMRKSRAAETPEQHAARLERGKMALRAKRAAMSPSEILTLRERRGVKCREFREKNRARYRSGGRYYETTAGWKRSHPENVRLHWGLHRIRQKDTFFQVLGDVAKIGDTFASQVNGVSSPGAV